MAAAEIAGAVGSVVGLAQTFIEGGKAKRANKDLQRLFKKRKAFTTPAEVFDILNLTESNAAQGFSDETINYLTGQAGSGLSAGLGTASRLGADPNQLSTLLDSYYQDIFKIGAENELVKMKKFDSLTNAIGLVAQNKEAEYQSRENLIKDQMQAAAARLGKAEQGVNSGLNFAIQGLTNLAASDLYKTKTPNSPEIIASNIPATVPAGRNLDFTIADMVGKFRRTPATSGSNLNIRARNQYDDMGL